MPAPQLTVHNAEIKTATVEIKTLTVSGKQVTLAVFRQLRRSELIADDGTLNGTPWGIVNYHPDKCDEPRYPHLHVVWQRGTELRRAHVLLNLRWHRFWPEAADDFIAAAYCANDHKLPEWAKQTYTSGGSTAEVHYSIGDIACTANTPGRCQATAYYTTAGGKEDVPPCRAADLNSLRGEVAAEVADESARRARHHATVKELAALPQLFIAV